MKPTIYVALFGWPLLMMAVFALLPARRAVIANFVAGWLLLPVATVSFPGAPDIDKHMSMSLAAMLGVGLFDTRRILAFRPSVLDLPILVFTISPMLSSVTNGLGYYDGGAAVLTAAGNWTIPYLIGRMYGSSAQGIKEIANGVLLGALAYIPICIWEMRMSPQLHYQLYGFYPFAFHSTYRLGGYRPVGFTNHGIELAMFMLWASILATWLYMRGAISRLAGMPFPLVAAAVVVIFLLCRSLGALILFVGGTGALLFASWTRNPALVVMLILVPPAYIGARLLGTVDDEGLIALVETVSADRAESLATRLYNEKELANRALEKAAFGWGGWGRSRIRIDEVDQSKTDGIWIILLGRNGFLGLGSWVATLLFPPVAVLRRFGRKRMLHPTFAWAFAVVVIVAVQATNWLMNGWPNPVIMLMTGSLVGLRPAGGRTSQQRPRSVRAIAVGAASGATDAMPPSVRPGSGHRRGQLHRS